METKIRSKIVKEISIGMLGKDVIDYCRSLVNIPDDTEITIIVNGGVIKPEHSIFIDYETIEIEDKVALGNPDYTPNDIGEKELRDLIEDPIEPDTSLFSGD